MNLQPLVERARGIARDPAFMTGVRDMSGTALGIGAWGLVTGVAMIKSGMSLPLALFMGLLVYAGSAQLAVLPLMAVGAPMWVVWFTAICVTLRFVILSSMWRSYFAHLRLRHRLAIAYFSGDVIFVGFMKRYPDARPQPEQLPYFWGAASTNWLAWQIPSTLGILLALGRRSQMPVVRLLSVIFLLLSELGNEGRMMAKKVKNKAPNEEASPSIPSMKL